MTVVTLAPGFGVTLPVVIVGGSVGKDRVVLSGADPKDVRLDASPTRPIGL